MYVNTDTKHTQKVYQIMRPFTERPTNRLAKQVYGSYRWPSTGSLSIVSAGVVLSPSKYAFVPCTKASTWGNVPWLRFTLNRGKLPRKCTITWKMCTVMSDWVVLVFRWFARYQEDWEPLGNDTRRGRPISARSNENVEKPRATGLQTGA